MTTPSETTRPTSKKCGPDLSPLEIKIWNLGRWNILGCKQTRDGRVRGTGWLGPLFPRLYIFLLIWYQIKLGRPYKNLARFEGKRVNYLIYPPAGSKSFLRTSASVLKGYLYIGGRSSVVAATIAVTYRCPCGCFHCSARRNKQPDRPEMSTAEVKRVIDQCLDMGMSVITFTGGEPLLRDDIYELVDYVDKKKAVAIVFTNGQLLDEDAAAKLKKAGLYSLFVSFDSDAAEEHDRCRNYPGLFDAAARAVKNAQREGLLVGLSSYCSRGNVERDHHLRMHSLAQRLGMLTVLLFDAIPTGSLLKDEQIMLTQAQHRRLAEHTNRVLSEGVVPPLASQSWQNTLMGYLSGISCFAGPIQIYITAYGDVTPCDFTPLSFGNVLAEPLRKIQKRIVRHPAYRGRNVMCRMQDPDFRMRYIHTIPEGTPLPYPIDKLPRADYSPPI